MLKVTMAGEIDVAERVLTSTELVAELVREQSAAVGELAVRPELLIVTTLGHNKAIETYFRSKANHAKNVGIGFTPDKCEDEDEALRSILRHNRNTTTHAIVPQLPFRDKDRAKELCDAVVDNKNVDALSDAGRLLYAPPTALASVELARRATNNFEGIAKDRVAVVGSLGKLIGSGAVELLREAGFDPIEIDQHNTHLIHHLGRDADVVITGMGRPGAITKEDLARPFGADAPMYIIDGGIGIGKDDRPAQDLDPGVFDLDYVWATKRTKAVGPLAVALMFGNVIAATEMQLLEA